MPSYAFLWRTSDFSMEVGETVTITLSYPNKGGDSISIWEDGVQIGTTTTNTYEYTPTSAGTHILHYFNTIECSPLTVTVTGGGVSGNDTTTLNGALETLGETLADNLTTMGVTDVDANDGLTTLARKILDIEQSGSEQEIVSFDNITTEFNYTRKRGSDGFSVTIPSGVTSLGNYCFSGCSGLTSVTIPSGVTTLGIYCFYNCSGLTNITIPSSVTSIGGYCFTNCTGLTNITIPSSVTSIGGYCFSGCTGLTNITIPSSVTSIGTYCFGGCTKLVDYQLYWETPPVTWNSSLMPNNTDTYFTIPNGTTANYTAKGFPSDKLIERNV